MAKDSNSKKDGNGDKLALNTLDDLIRLNLSTLEDVVNGDIDNKTAALIFTGSRTAIGGLKLGVEVMKLGIKKVGGIGLLSDK